MAYLTVANDQRIYYADHGSGELAVFLIHGWGMNARVWDGVLLSLLDSGHRVVVMDHRGCGRSDHDFADLGIRAIASDVVAVTQALGITRVVLNGWSLGGAVATYAAQALGDTCIGLVLTAGASPIYTQKPDLALGGTADDVAATVAAMNADRINFLSQLSHAVCAKPVSEQLTDWMARCFIDSSARASSTLGELAHLDQREILLALDIPVLSFICGQDGFVAPGISQWVADNHPRGQGVTFPDSGHAPFIEAKDAYLAELQKFIASL